MASSGLRAWWHCGLTIEIFRVSVSLVGFSTTSGRGVSVMTEGGFFFFFALMKATIYFVARLIMVMVW